MWHYCVALLRAYNKAALDIQHLRSDQPWKGAAPMPAASMRQPCTRQNLQLGPTLCLTDTQHNTRHSAIAQRPMQHAAQLQSARQLYAIVLAQSTAH